MTINDFNADVMYQSCFNANIHMFFMCWWHILFELNHVESMPSRKFHHFKGDDNMLSMKKVVVLKGWI